MSTAERWQAWMSACDVDGVGCRVVWQPSAPSGADADARCAALATAGYLAVCPRTSPALHVHDERLRRHVALLVDDRWGGRARQWVRALARSSPRAHLVIVTGEPPSRSPVVVRERAMVWDGPVVVDRRWRRAAALAARSRRDAAARWFLASVVAAARRRDADQFVSHLNAAWNAAGAHPGPTRVALGREARQALEWLVDRDHYALAACLAACDAVDDALFDRAEAWCAGVEVECLCDGDEPSAMVRAVQMDVALWTGRFAEAEVLCAQTPEGEHAYRRSVLAWLRGDQAPIDEGGETPSVWTHAMTAAATGRWPVRPVHERRAARLLREAVTHVPGALARADVWGAHGVRRWCLRRDTMGMWGGVAALLDVLNEANDERAVLERGCRWVRTHTGAEVVRIIEAERNTVMAVEPPGAVAHDADLQCDIRHGGVTIGWVAARAGRQVSSRDELDGCLKALAAACAPALRARLDAVRAHNSGDALSGQLLGRSPAMQALRDTIARVAPTTFPVLIEGESGVGKELVARAIHRLSPRRERTCAAINCAAITDELFEAEVFGHTRGAFTGAVTGRTGLFEEAHQGTLFLDEVAELSPRAQAKLLRVLQDGQVRRVGDNAGRAVDVRVIAATNRPLAQAARDGQFREDLVFRLAVVRIQVPPLRDRVEDIPELAAAFWARAVAHRPTRAWLGPDALAALCRHRWPGNIRELQNVVAGLVLAAPARGPVTARHVADVLRGDDEVAVESLAAARKRMDTRLVTTALARHGGCRAAAARDLGVSRQGLGKLMARLGIREEVASSPVLR
ncbi:MAG: sigma-54 interaction domain-containing protein [Vicinamibacterales bacterium]